VVVAVAEVVALAELWLWWLAVLRRRLLVRVCDGDGALHGAPRGRFRRGSGVGGQGSGSPQRVAAARRGVCMYIAARVEREQVRLSLGGCLSAISWPSLDHLSAISRPSLDYLSAISRLSLGHLSAISRPSLGYLSRVEREQVRLAGEGEGVRVVRVPPAAAEGTLLARRRRGAALARGRGRGCVRKAPQPDGAAVERGDLWRGACGWAAAG